jgi:hypothetical protein
MAVLNPILVYPASISEFTIVYYSSRDGEVTITRNDFSKNSKLSCLQYDGTNIQNIVSAVASSYPEPRMSEEQDQAGESTYTVDFRPEKLYAYTKESIDMYAWTIEEGSEVTPSSCNTIYTKTPILDLNNGVFYDENGVEYTTSPKVTPDLTLKYSDSSNDFISTYVLEATDEKITMGATSLD